MHDDRGADGLASTGRKLVFVGDGNNVARSLAVASALLGLEFVLAAPPGYEFPAEFSERFAATFPEVPLHRRARPARRRSSGADVVYTDVWASMGQEHEAESGDARPSRRSRSTTSCSRLARRGDLSSTASPPTAARR